MEEWEILIGHKPLGIDRWVRDAGLVCNQMLGREENLEALTIRLHRQRYDPREQGSDHWAEVGQPEHDKEETKRRKEKGRMPSWNLRQQLKSFSEDLYVGVFACLDVL